MRQFAEGDVFERCIHPTSSAHPSDFSNPSRSAALLLSVNHLVLVTKQACRLPSTVQWIDGSLGEMEDHLQVLREIALAREADSGAGSLSSGTEGSYQPMLGEEFRSSFRGGPLTPAPKHGSAV